MVSIITVLSVVVSPFIVSKITSAFKKTMSVTPTQKRVAVIRLFVAVASFSISLANAWLMQQQIETSVVEAFIDSLVLAVLTYFGASGAYLLKKEDNKV